MTSPDQLPALLGGPPVRPQGPPDWPLPDPDVAEALRRAYESGCWGKYHGGSVERLEEQLARYHDVAFALTCGSGTFAVETALRAFKIGPGDEVILAAYDYPGNFHCVHAVGATPVLVDVDADNWNLAPEQLARAVSPKTRAVIASHLHGGIVPMREVCDFASVRGLRVVEDAAQATGAVIEGRRAGTWGDVGVLSFGGSKLLTAGRGGALLIRDASVWQRARVFLHRGNHVCPLSELQAAVLAPQLTKLDDRNRDRADNVRRLAELLKDLPGCRLFANRCADCQPAYYKLGIQFDAPKFGLPRDLFLAAIRAEGIAVDEGFRALHVGRSPRRLRRLPDLSEAERAHAGAVVLHHPMLLGEVEDIETIALAVRKVYANRDLLARATGEHSKTE
jgi:dTDP-4-amino-4,6-dideoxygalactose transaminase